MAVKQEALFNLSPAVPVVVVTKTGLLTDTDILVVVVVIETGEVYRSRSVTY